MKKILYIVEPMIGIGPNVDANTVAKTAIKSFPDLEMVVYMDDQIPLKYSNDKVKWYKSASWRYDSVNEQIKDLQGNLLTDEFKNNRRDELLAIYNQFRPDVLLLHNYISGSKWDNIIDFEMLPLIEHARKVNPNIKVYSFLIGMIDSFENMTPVEEFRFVNSVKSNIDRIYLRSDNTELFFKTCPTARRFKELFVPVGYSGESTIPAEIESYKDRKEVIVSAGGSDLGFDLFKTSIETFYLAHEKDSKLADYDWRLFIGPLQEKNKQKLLDLNDLLLNTKRLKTKLFIEDHVSPEEFLSVLCHNCVLSISQCGQRTFTELEIAGVPSVVVPRESEGKEFEQLYRAKYMEECSRALVIREFYLDSEYMLTKLNETNLNRHVKIGLRLDGIISILQHISDN